MVGWLLATENKEQAKKALKTGLMVAGTYCALDLIYHFFTGSPFLHRKIDHHSRRLL